MRTDQPPVIRLNDYRAPDFRIERTELEFDLAPSRTRVAARLTIARNAGVEPNAPLVLDGEELELESIAVDGRPLSPNTYQLDQDTLTIPDIGDTFTLETVVFINPKANTKLEGLYRSKSCFCTQCEAEGFRRITYFLDRPDSLSTYKVTIRAEAAECPVLLSNGNKTDEGTLPDGRHYTVWEDPFPKPSYLFALVAGELEALEDEFTTRSGRKVALRIFTEPGNARRSTYAMDALKRSFKWDEDRFGLEYDLDIFNIVAVSDFNMGAMENKSLNIFNAKYILADPQTATDNDYANIESIVGHEYFHNWTGNRITCRDWFQLSLKEGLTVFRDQEFSADMRSRPVKRIQDVRMLRARQFPEDAGPLAHPVRPDSYIEINNFYTATVYEKGAEVIRMLHALLGEDGFQRGMRLYIERHDGQAVTCEDFVASMADANDADLECFKRWYSQAGTPKVSAEWTHDAANRRFTLRLSQETKPTPGQPDKAPVPIPLSVALIRPDGEKIGDDHVVMLDEAEKSVTFDDVEREAVPSINRGFSAPIALNAAYRRSDLAFLMAHDDDPFARWEAAQQYATALLLDHVAALKAGEAPEEDHRFIEAMVRTATDETLDPAFRAQFLSLPSEDFLGEQMETIDVDGIHTARKVLVKSIGTASVGAFHRLYDALGDDGAYTPDAKAAGRRALRNMCLNYLSATESAENARLVKAHYDEADNMTDRMAALAALNDSDTPARDAALAAFEERFGDDEQVMDKWFAVQATAALPDTLPRVEALRNHPAFSIRNPNKVRALIGSFAAGNPVCFHKADGSGYRFLADRVIELDRLNPQVAARLLGPLGRWRRFDSDRAHLMKDALERVLATKGLSADCYEIASKALGTEK